MILLQHVCTGQGSYRVAAVALCLVDYCTQLTPSPYLTVSSLHLSLSLLAPQVAILCAQTRFAIIMPFLQFIKLFSFFMPSLLSTFSFFCLPTQLSCFCVRIFWFAFISIFLFFVYFIAMANPLQTAHINASPALSICCLCSFCHFPLTISHFAGQRAGILPLPSPVTLHCPSWRLSCLS